MAKHIKEWSGYTLDKKGARKAVARIPDLKKNDSGSSTSIDLKKMVKPKKNN